MTFTRRNALIWLSLVWLALRIYPALTGYSLRSGPEIWQAHKVVDDYGFMRLRAILTNPVFLRSWRAEQ